MVADNFGSSKGHLHDKQWHHSYGKPKDHVSTRG